MSEIYTDPPQSRNEAIIRATIDGTQYTAPPQSRMEDLLLELKEAIEQGGGGGGTKDYEALDNKPSINDVELSGNKTSSDLGLMDHYDIDERPTEDSENLIPSGAVYEADKNINDKLQGSKTAGSTDGSPFEIPDYGMTESIQMYFKPTQDLHGYDKPWAGGAGKNKLPYFTAEEQNNIRLTYDDGVVVLDGTASANAFFILSNLNLTSNDYVFSANNDTVNGGVHISLREIGASSDFADLPMNDTDKHNIYQNVSIGQITLYVISGTQLTNFKLPLQIEVGDSKTDFEPYSNICPISGQDNATFSWTDDEDIETEVSMNFGNTYYGGFCQFNGQIYPDWDYIASYNGETLSGEWVSDRDEYVAGTTPTIGAEVAYKTTPSYVRVTPPANLNLTDDYPIEYNGYMANISYQPKNTVLAEAKKYTNQKLLSAGLPIPPTTDGTYHLECSVSGGIPTIRWVSNS